MQVQMLTVKALRRQAQELRLYFCRDLLRDIGRYILAAKVISES